MLHAIRSVWALYAGVALLLLGLGLHGTLLGLRATLEGFDVSTTGLIMSAYYLGFLLGGWAAPQLVRQVGHIRVFAALASVASTMVLAHAVFVVPVAWFAMRLVTGFSIAVIYVIVESWLNHAATNETRGKILSLYTVIAVAAMALSQLLLNVAAPEEETLFIVVSALVSFSLVPIALTPTAAPPIDQPRPITIRELYAASPLGVLGCLVSGIAQGAFFSLAAVYATLIGLDVSTTALFVAFPLVGAVLLQFPVGALSDRYDRRLVLTALSAIVAAVALVNIAALVVGPLWQLVGVTVFGALMIPIYALSISHMNDYLETDQMLGASARLMLVYGVGSASGPVIIGTAMESLGEAAFFWAFSLVHIALAVFAFYRMTQRRSLPSDEQADFSMVAPPAIPAAASMVVEMADDTTSSGSDPASTYDPAEAP